MGVKVFLALAVVLVSVVLLGCIDLPPVPGAGGPVVSKFAQTRVTGYSGNAFYDYREDNGSYRLSGVVWFPNGCGRLTGAKAFQAEGNLVVELESVEQGEFCTQALRAYQFELTVEGARPGGSVVVVSQGTPLPNEPAFCGGIAAIPCPEGLYCVLDGRHPDAGGKCLLLIQ